MVKEIELTKGKITIVDDKDYEWLSQYKWHALKGTNTSYAGRSIRNGNKKEHFLMHRLILQVPKDFEVDHRNGNGLDNRRENLRPCTKSQNQQNRHILKGTTSRFRGVSSNRDKWRARIKFLQKEQHLGTFTSEEDAAEAYNTAARTYFGEFARLNYEAEGTGNDKASEN